MISVAGHRVRRSLRLPSRGQSLVEYAMTVPVFMLILLGMLEFGIAFSHHLTMEYATREGARTGAALNNGTDQILCNGTNDQNVDNQVIAAVQRVLTASGSQIKIADVKSVHIYKATSTGAEPSASGQVNIWVPGTSTQSVGGSALQFSRSQFNWNPCGRDADILGVGDPVDSIGVSITYDYTFVTPLPGLLRVIGGSDSSGSGDLLDGVMRMTDRTIMALNPDPV